MWFDVIGGCIKGRNTKSLDLSAGSSLADCKRACESAKDFKCSSIDYGISDRKCHLSVDNRESAGSDYLQNCPTKDYVYSEIIQGW